MRAGVKNHLRGATMREIEDKFMSVQPGSWGHLPRGAGAAVPGDPGNMKKKLVEVKGAESRE